MKKRVLFVCTGNSARSQMAEGLLRARVGTRMDVFSAGTHPKGLNSLAVKVMMEAGTDISGHQSKDISEFEGQNFDFVITVCDRAKQSCPVFPGTKLLHWDIADPEDLEAFRAARDELAARVHQFIHENLTD
jgi:arsenate reductase